MKTVTFCLLMMFGMVSIFYCGGCTKKPSQEEMQRLEEHKAAAESAEKKLSELRKERIKLESDLEGKKEELNTLEAEKQEAEKEMGQ